MLPLQQKEITLKMINRRKIRKIRKIKIKLSRKRQMNKRPRIRMNRRTLGISSNWEDNAIYYLREYQTKSSTIFWSLSRLTGTKSLKMSKIRSKIKNRMSRSLSQRLWRLCKMSNLDSIIWSLRKTSWRLSKLGTCNSCKKSFSTFTVSCTSSSTYRRTVFSKKSTASSVQSWFRVNLASPTSISHKSVQTVTSISIRWLRSSWPSTIRRCTVARVV